ncbi:DUF423 domain-containing protein [Mucilaginibacter myungsuensis]|uniref:DUF423 domain-containing protein n=1 Tax=Mucilaginibacter myungsuensis TaxID=649104 RepID=A0A929PVU9_9SPHI|nr:DUF423 domain-containing protein [Mucilaginibacter myungsuensis]MBE9662163.1 DUF423 domain-containing protein [Mucilaginibacter myungsuensis]MDN3599403.1 DUF423 domain-containing protein [Mucilaginibacter myungsuensis]
MNKQIIITAAFFGMLAVVLGAFGAHALKAVFTPAHLDTWHTAVQYHFYHVFALLFLSTFARFKTGLIAASFYLFTAGIIFFSGSLYLLSCRDVLNISWLHILGPITPVGGFLFIAGWVTLALAAYRNK